MESDINKKQINPYVLILFLVISISINLFQFNFNNTLKEEKILLQGAVSGLNEDIYNLNEEQLLADTLKKESEVLIDKKNQKIISLDAKTKRYLSLKKEEVCVDDAEICLDKIFSRLTDSVISYTAKGGICILRGNVNMPAESDPDVGPGYAKMTKDGAYGYEQIKNACTIEDYQKLLKLYCEKNTEQVQYGVGIVDNEFGGISGSGCGKFGCGYIGCPPGI